MIIKGTLTLVKNLIAGGNVQVGNSGLVKLADADSSNFINLKAPATVSSDITLTFPNGVGTNGQALTTDGSSGVLSWTTIGGSPAGSGTELQYKNGSALGAVTNSAVSSSSVAIGTTTTSNAQLSVHSSGSTLPALRLQSHSSAAGSIDALSIYDGNPNLTVRLQTDGSFSFPFLTYSSGNRTLSLSTAGAPTVRGLVVGVPANFATATQTEFLNVGQNVIGLLNGTSTYTTGVTFGHEDSVGGTSVTMVGAKIFGISNQTSGTGTKTAVYGLEAYARTVNTGGATTVSGAVIGAANSSTATVTNLTGLTIAAPTNNGTATNTTGINIKSQYLASSTSKAIYSEGGEVRFDTGNANARGLVIRATGSQSANLLAIEDNSGNPLVTVGGSGYLSGQFLNSGLAIRDSDSSHKLTFTTGSNLTSDRSLTVNTGDASRTLQLDGDTTISGVNRIWRTQDNSAGIEIQGSVLGANTQGTLFGTSGVITIPANWFVTGSTIAIQMRGHFITASSPGNYTFRVKLGSVVLAASAATAMQGSLGTGGDPFSGAPFNINIDLSCLTTGATGGIDAVGEIVYNSSGTTPVRIPMLNNGNTINTATSQNLDVTIEMSSGLSGNYVEVFTIKAIGYKA